MYVQIAQVSRFVLITCRHYMEQQQNAVKIEVMVLFLIIVVMSIHLLLGMTPHLSVCCRQMYIHVSVQVRFLQI